MAAILAGLAAAGGSCRAGTEEGEAEPGPAVSPSEPIVYVAVGASESVGMGADRPRDQAWPVVLHRSALPPGSELVNLGVPGATVADAVRTQLPAALARRPGLATVWLNVNDILRGVPVAAYERQLGQLVHALRRGGATLVLVANTPAFDLLPVYQSCRAAGAANSECPPPRDGLNSPSQLDDVVAAYNHAIERVARREGAVVVDLHGAGLAALEAGTAASFVGADGFHPSTAGHRALAAAFTAALLD